MVDRPVECLSSKKTQITKEQQMDLFILLHLSQSWSRGKVVPPAPVQVGRLWSAGRTAEEGRRNATGETRGDWCSIQKQQRLETVDPRWPVVVVEGGEMRKW